MEHRNGTANRFAKIVLLTSVLLVFLLFFSGASYSSQTTTLSTSLLSADNTTTNTDSNVTLNVTPNATFNATNTTTAAPSHQSPSFLNTTPLQTIQLTTPLGNSSSEYNTTTTISEGLTRLQVSVSFVNASELITGKILAHYTQNKTPLADLSTYCELRENSVGNWTSSQLMHFNKTRGAYEYLLTLPQEPFLFYVTCFSNKAAPLSVIEQYAPSPSLPNTSSPDLDAPSVASSSPSQTDTQPLRTTDAEMYLDDNFSLPPAEQTTQEKEVHQTEESERVIVTTANKEIIDENDTGIVFFENLQGEQTNLSVSLVTREHDEQMLFVHYTSLASGQFLTGLSNYCELRDNSQGNWSSPLLLSYNATAQAYTTTLSPTQDYWFQVTCASKTLNESLFVIGEAKANPTTIMTFPEETITITDATKPLTDTNSPQAISYQTSHGLFTLTTPEGVLERFGVTDDLTLSFTLVNVSPREIPLELQLPFALPEHLHIYLWKELDSGLKKIPYALHENRTALTLTLQDGVIDDDGEVNGIIVDPFQLTLPTYEFSVKHALDRKRANVLVDSRELVVTTPKGELETVAVVDPLNLPLLPGTPTSFTHKLVRFTADTLGAEALDVYFTYDYLPRDFELWKFNAETLTWYTYPFERVNSTTLKITLYDGGLGDEDGTVNGVIVDDVGLVSLGTELFIGDSSDEQTIYDNEANYFYANYTNASTGDALPNASTFCLFTENSTGAWSALVNMTYNADNKLYELEKTSPAGTFMFNVSCYSTNTSYQNITLNETFTITADTLAPTSTFVSPTPLSGSSSATGNVSVNVTFSDVGRGDNSISSFLMINSSLVNWWRMDDISGTTLQDYFDHTSGTMTGSPQVINGTFGEALQFDGASNYVQLNSSIVLESVSLWANFSAITSTSYFLGGSAQGVRYSGTEFLVFNGGTGWTTVPWTKQNEWVHFVAVRQAGENYDIYINGQKIGTGYAGAGGDIFISYFGRRSDSYYFNGSLDEIMFFNKTLTPAEIQALYANETTDALEQDFNNLSEGTHSFDAYSQDVQGNLAVTSSTVVVDFSSPQIDIISPSASVYTSQNVTINISATDASAVDDIWYLWNGSNVTYTTPITVTASEGFSTLHIWANDTLGHESYANVTFEINLTYIDTQSPTITIVSPQNTSYGDNPLLLSVSTNDDIAVDSVWYSWNGTNTSYANAGNVSFGEGSNTLNVWVNDTSNNTNLSTVTFFIDSLGPAVSLVSPTPATATNWTTSALPVNVSFSEVGRGNTVVSTFVDVDDSLVAWWQMDDISENTLSDYTDKHSGTLVNSPQVVAGYFGDALAFDGATSYVTSTASNALGITQEATLSTWFTCAPGVHGTANSPTAGRMINLHQATPGTAFALIAGSDGLGWYNSEQGTFLTSGSDPCDNAWHLATVTIDDSGLVTLYKDGVHLRNQSGGSLTLSAYPLHLGSYEGSTRFFNGTMDDVLIFNRSLTASDVSALYASSVSGYASHTYTILDEANHTFQAYSQDTYANIGTTSLATVYVDSLAPRLTLTSPSPGLYYFAKHLVSISAVDDNLDSVWYSWNGTNTTYVAPLNITFPEGIVTLHVWTNDSFGHTNYTNLTFEVRFDQSPNVTNQLPADAYATVLDVTFNCSVSDDRNLSNVTLYLTNSTNESFSANKSTPLTGITNQTSWTLSLKPGQYTWNCFIEDNASYGSWGNNHSIIVNENASAIYTSFSGNTTDFNTHPTPEAILGATLDAPTQAQIVWTGSVNASNQDFDAHIVLGENLVFVNVSGLHDSFNSSANVTLRNLSWTYPLIYRNGELCDTCTVLDYNAGDLTFFVTGFSSYTTAEGTNLSIWDTSDTLEVFNDEQNYFYANYTNISSGNAITGVDVYCEFTENSSGSWSALVNMTYNSSTYLYEYNKTLASGIAQYNISCFNSQGYANLSTTDATNITRRPTRELHVLNITYATTNPIEGSRVEVYVNVSNTGNESATGFTLELNTSLWNGTSGVYDETLSLLNQQIAAETTKLFTLNWTAQPGTYLFDAFVDSDFNVTELHETNNTYQSNLTVSAWAHQHGDINHSIYLGAGTDVVVNWTDSSKEGYIFFYDVDSAIDVTKLAALGTGSDDFVEADNALGMTGFTDSIQKLFDSDGNDAADNTTSVTIFGTTITNVPITRSTNASSPFFTGVMWDASLGGEYDGSQDLVFVAIVHANTAGLYGTYDYEVRVPTLLKSWTGSNDYFAYMTEFT